MRFRFHCLAAVLVFLAASAAEAQPRPGVGYDPQARGLTVSRYQLDTLLGPFLNHLADFTARPDLAGANPNPYVLDFSDAAVREAIERRWGPGTSTQRFKRWAGPGNEVRFLLREALIWAWKNQPELLGGDTSNRNGEPTEVEMIDIQAFNDRGLWVTYFQEELTGFSPERRIVICDPDKPSGDGEEKEPFWGLPYYYHNRYQAPPPVSPQIPASEICRQK